MLGHGHMSSGGLYKLMLAIHMCDDMQGCQEEPSPPIDAKAEAQAQGYQEEPLPPIDGKAEAQA